MPAHSTPTYYPPSSYNVRYTFSAKEKDAETGYSYFGARYYNSALSIWLSVDPMAGKYPSMSPYVYCAGNPVRCVDLEGKEWETTEDAIFADLLIKQAVEKQKLYSSESEEYQFLQEGIDGLTSMCEEEGQIYTFNKSNH